MAVLTSTDLGAAGRYVNFGSPDALDNLGAQTIIVYARPVSSGANQFFFTKAGTTSTGCRMWIDHNSGSPRFAVGAHSTGTAGNPNTSGTQLTGKVVYGQWQHYQMTWNGTISGTSLASFVDDVSAQSASAHYAGTGSVANDASNSLYLMNRQELDRSFTGDFAYFAIWSRVLNATERATVRADGPLSVPDGLVLVYANQSDLGPNELAISARTTYVAGALPPNTALGGGVTSSASIDATTENATFSGAASGYVPAAGVTISAVTEDAVFSGTAVGQQTLTTAMVHVGDGFNTHPTNSSVTDPNTATPLVTIVPRTQYCDSVTKWRNFQFRLKNVSGKTPSFRVPYADYVMSSFASVWRPWYSYDGINWTQWPTATTTSAPYQLFGGVTFTEDSVYLGFQPGYPVARAKWLIEWLVSNHPGYIHPLRSTGADWVAQMLPAQTDELGRTVPAQPFYTYGIWDAQAYPDDGKPKRTVVLTCGNHPGETVADWMFEGVIRFLVGNDADAIALRKNFQFVVYPQINPLGRYGGHWRGEWDTAALDKNSNRDYVSEGGNVPFKLANSRAVRDSLALDIPGRTVACHLDFHGQEGSPSGNPVAFWFAAASAAYRSSWQTRMRVYNTAYTEQLSDGAGTLRLYISNIYHSIHGYTPEAYEQRKTTNGTADFELFGEHLARALTATFAASSDVEARFVGKSAVLDFGNSPADGPLSASLWSGVPGHGGALLSAEKLGVGNGTVAIDASAASGSEVFVLLTDDGEASPPRSFAATIDLSVST